MATHDATARVLTLVNRQAATRETITRRLLAALARLWAGLEPADRYSNTAVTQFASSSASLVRTARTTASGSTQAYLRQILAELDAEPGRVKVTVPAAPRGVDPVE